VGSGDTTSTNSPVPPGLFNAALENLVRQFARPLDCLRELVQNSIDAGSPRVEVVLGWTPSGDDAGVLSIAVQDFGEGMDEHVIDNELTRMFASSKAGDLSKIGRFGIGFTSVFAIAPEVVHVETGRHGKSWELVFHADRSFDKLALDSPRSGTRITLFKRIPTARRLEWRRDIEDALTFWCEHCQVPVSFDDSALLDGPAASAAPDPHLPADPFAAFEEAAAPVARVITRPLDLPDTDWVVQHEEDGIQVWAGLGRTPAYRWYNGGLTLLSTTEPSCLGEHHDTLGHLRFKVQDRRLEHTLTRDNVIQDDAWKRAIDVLGRAAAKVEARIHEAHLEAAKAHTDLTPTLKALATIAGHTGSLARPREVHVPQLEGPPTLLVQRVPFELARRPTPLATAVARTRATVLVDSLEVRALARALQVRLPVPVDRRWVLIEANAPPDPTLVGAIHSVLRRAAVHSLTLHWCRVHGLDAPFAVTREPKSVPMRRTELDAGALSRLMGVRDVWVNVDHRNVALAARVARVAPDLAAFALLQGVFASIDALRSRRFDAIREAVQA